MGVYAITGASSGIGAKTKELLEQEGHKVINIDLKGGDICVNLATEVGRTEAVGKLHELCPDGLDGMICNAGVSGACGNLALIISLNYFGTVAVAKGVYDLLEKKHGSCVVTASNTISQGAGRMDIADLLNNIGDEKRVLELISSLDNSNLSIGNSMYVSTKYALARWVRRVSASWAANGVRINAIAPGNVNTAMTATMSTSAKMALNALPIPTKFGTETLMDASEIAEAMIFLVSPKASGINGNVMFVDGGTDALLNSEKVY
ncbi:MAG: SDR family oxidoreductase [Lachnospiraceae bacterium]|nr:SDR family oxidoreductase [Lachnospiraceae bacterium]